MTNLGGAINKGESAVNLLCSYNTEKPLFTNYKITSS